MEKKKKKKTHEGKKSERGRTENTLRNNFRKEDVGFAFRCCSSPSNARRRENFPRFEGFFMSGSTGVSTSSTVATGSASRSVYTSVYDDERETSGSHLSVVFRRRPHVIKSPLNEVESAASFELLNCVINFIISNIADFNQMLRSLVKESIFPKLFHPREHRKSFFSVYILGRV